MGKQIFEKVLDLDEYGGGLAIYKVSIDLCKEQDRNARVMDKEVYDQLMDNIGQHKSLESLPFGYVKADRGGENKLFFIISGHHRLRAARSAEIPVVYVLATERELSNDEIISKQLSHNALSGYDDSQMLKALYDDIKSIDMKTRAGLRNTDFENLKLRNIPIDSVDIKYDYEAIKLIFLSSQTDSFEKACEAIYAHERVYVADKLTEFDRVVETVKKVSKNDNVRNIAGIIGRMCDIVLTYYEEHPESIVPDSEEKTVDSLAGVMKVFTSVTGRKVEEIRNISMLKDLVGKTLSEIGEECLRIEGLVARRK